MNCPRCQIDFGTKKMAEIEIEECSRCGGTWLEEEELRKAKDQTDPDLVWMDFEIWQHSDRFKVTPAPLQCPRCEIEMAAVEYDTTKIEIDYCTRCQGVWLDAGELEKIIEALEEELINKDLPGYIAASLNEAREVLSGPETLASEWKDLRTVLRMLEYRVLSNNPAVARALETIQFGNPLR